MRGMQYFSSYQLYMRRPVQLTVNENAYVFNTWCTKRHII